MLKTEGEKKMSKNKKQNQPQMNRDEKARIEARQHQMENMAMNKYFLQASNDDGTQKYPIVNDLLKYKLLDVEKILDLMRQISAFVAQIRHHENRIKRLQEQYTSGTVVEKDEHGRLYTKEELYLQIVSEKINIPREISRIREYAVDRLLPMIDEVRFTGEQYNTYICKLNDEITKLGYTFLPDKVELIYAEF
jgi:hypothetical protein